ncbi:MAG: hypothetical protein AB7P24_20575 [Nitrospira sp.]
MLSGDFKAFGRFYGTTIGGVITMPPAVYLKSTEVIADSMANTKQDATPILSYSVMWTVPKLFQK